MDSSPEDQPAPRDNTLLIGVVIAVAVVFLTIVYRLWKSDSSESNTGLLDEDYNIELPPECAEYDELKETEGADEDALKKALMKKAVSLLPVRAFMQGEEKKMQEMYRKSMASSNSMKSFQEALSLVVEESESVTQDAESMEEKWGERIWAEAQFLYQNTAAMLRAVQQREMQLRQMKAKVGSSPAQAKQAEEVQEENLTEEQRKKIAEKAAQELIREEEQSARKKSGGKNKKGKK